MLPRPFAGPHWIDDDRQMPRNQVSYECTRDDPLAYRWKGTTGMRGVLVDLFSGGGGFGLAAAQAGFDVVAAVDVDPDLSWSHKLNFPNTRMIVDDLATIDLRSILGRAIAGCVDGVIGGPPCQGFSSIGHGRVDDPRNQLISAYFRHVRSLEPRFFVMENVAGLLAPGSKHLLSLELEAMSARYDIHGPVILNAKDFGAATDRRRVVVAGIHRDVASSFSLSSLTGRRQVSVRDAIADLSEAVELTNADGGLDWWQLTSPFESTFARTAQTPPPPGAGWSSAVEALHSRQLTGLKRTLHSRTVAERFASVDPGRRDRVGRHHRLIWDGLAPTLRAGTGKDHGSFQSVRPLHPDEPRVITVREAARLQGFPDWFVFHPTVWHSFRMIGNSVSPPMGKAILDAIAAAPTDSCSPRP